jgi:hypothetical protein
MFWTGSTSARRNIPMIFSSVMPRMGEICRSLGSQSTRDLVIGGYTPVGISTEYFSVT